MFQLYSNTHNIHTNTHSLCVYDMLRMCTKSKKVRLAGLTVSVELQNFYKSIYMHSFLSLLEYLLEYKVLPLYIHGLISIFM